MHVKQWMTRVRKPGLVQVAAVSMIALMAVGAIVLVAHQATPSVSASASVKAAAPSAAPAPVAKATSGNPKTAHGAAAVHVPEIVTLTGCLEQKDDSFRLKDTSGADAPKSRSAKTLFLTKHSSSVTVLDSSKKLKLGSHVGERVSVTGPLVDKEMQGRTLQRVATSCD
jgi:phosphate-selective porin